MERIKKYLLRKYFAKKYNLKTAKGVMFNRDSKFGGFNAIGINTEFTSSFVGIGTYIANNSKIRNAKIGKFCAIGDNVITCLGSHPLEKIVSIHPSFYSTKKQAGFSFSNSELFESHKFIDNEKKFVVEIGSDVWIGNNVTFMDGVKVGDGAVIAAGSVVTKNIETYEIVGGIPAKLIKNRFTKEQSELLLKIKWWDWDFAIIKERWEEFKNIDTFLSSYGK